MNIPMFMNLTAIMIVVTCVFLATFNIYFAVRDTIWSIRAFPMQTGWWWAAHVVQGNLGFHYLAIACAYAGVWHIGVTGDQINPGVVVRPILASYLIHLAIFQLVLRVRDA